MVRKKISVKPVENKDLQYTEETNIEHINNLIVTSEDLNPDSSEDTNENSINNVEEKPVVKAVDKKSEEVKEIRTKEVVNEINKEVKTRTESKPVQKESQKIMSKPKNHADKDKNNVKKKNSTIKKYVERTKMAKEHKKVSRHEKHHKKHSKMTWVWVVLAIIIVAAVAVLLIKGNYIKPINQTTSEIAATVNGEPIYLQDIDDQYNNINPLLQSVYTKEAILNQTIDELLLVQEAKNLNIKATDEEVKTELDNFKLQNQLTDTGLEDILEKQNITIVELEDLIRKKLVVKELLNRTIFTNINITAQDIEKYYDENKEQFATSEQVEAAHILIMIKDNVTDADAYTKILDINKSLTSTNFCELVTKYTEDPGSKDTCGTYTFGRGEMVAEFEDAAFSLDVNEITIVKTIYGYHLIKKLAYTSAGTPSLSEASEDIKQTLHDIAAQENFDEYLQTLRNKAVVVNYLVKTDKTEDIPAETNTQDTVSTETNTGNTETTTSVEVIPQEDTKTTITEPEPTKSLDSFAKCLTEKGAKFYDQCPHCNNQKTLFGDSIKYVTYVECAVEDNPQIQTPECGAAGITGYPTWTINNQQYPGEQTLAQLSKLSGCQI